DENCVGSLLLQTCEGHINIHDCTSVNDLHLPSNIRSSGVSLSDQRLGNCTVWINERGDTLGFGDEFMEEPEPLSAQLYVHKTQSSNVSAWPVIARHETRLRRIGVAHENDWDCCCRVLGGKRSGRAERSNNDGDATLDQVRHQLRQAIFLGVRIAVFDG